MKDYIPELSEIRMVRRAPPAPFRLNAADGRYIEACLRDMEKAFATNDFAGLAPAQIPGRALIERFIHWWRTLEPADSAQRDAHARLPGAIRLLDTVSAWLEERGGGPGAP